jgi:hypothetical protein
VIQRYRGYAYAATLHQRARRIKGMAARLYTRGIGQRVASIAVRVWRRSEDIDRLDTHRKWNKRQTRSSGQSNVD